MTVLVAKKKLKKKYYYTNIGQGQSKKTDIYFNITKMTLKHFDIPLIQISEASTYCQPNVRHHHTRGGVATSGQLLL